MDIKGAPSGSERAIYPPEKPPSDDCLEAIPVHALGVLENVHQYYAKFSSIISQHDHPTVFAKLVAFLEEKKRAGTVNYALFPETNEVNYCLLTCSCISKPAILI